MPVNANFYGPYDAGTGANLTEDNWRKMARLWATSGIVAGQLNELNPFGDSTGLQAKVPLKFIPAGFGNWYARAGAQYHHLLNDNLLYAQTFTRALPGPVGSPSSSARRNIDVLFGALGFDF